MATRVRLSNAARACPRLSSPSSSTEAGFTLVELALVLLVMAILLAVAIPTFLGASNSATDRAAQSNLSSAISEIQDMFAPNQSYSTVWLAAADLATSAPEYSWEQKKACTAKSAGNCVSEYPVDVVSPAGGRGVILATRSKTGVCWYAVDLEANPITSKFTDTGGTKQFLAGTTNNKSPNNQEIGTSPLATAGVFYSQGSPTSCDASTPTAKGVAWTWSTSYATAPENSEFCAPNHGLTDRPHQHASCHDQLRTPYAASRGPSIEERSRSPGSPLRSAIKAPARSVRAPRPNREPRLLPPRRFEAVPLGGATVLGDLEFASHRANRRAP